MEIVRESSHKISELTRRNIADAITLEHINWSGRFEEQEFLGRLYDVVSMPSHDHRYSNASDDIWKHRAMNNDWGDDWVFYDSRFSLLQAPDEEFLRFLCEVLHPVVQTRPEEVERIRDVFNSHLAVDGWELREQMSISGRPVFAAFPVLESDFHTHAAATVVSETIGTEYVSRQVTRMQSAIHSDPDLAIGQAKEFVETICKTILAERGITCDGVDFPQLVRLAANNLELVPQSVTDAAKATESVKRLLSNLATISNSMAEIRNLHGTGHGREANITGLELRHARLTVGAAVALAVFLLESHRDMTP